MVPAGSQVTASCLAPQVNLNMLKIDQLMMPSGNQLVTPTKPKKTAESWSPEKKSLLEPMDKQRDEEPAVAKPSLVEEVVAQVAEKGETSSSEEEAWLPKTRVVQFLGESRVPQIGMTTKARTH